MVDKTDANFEGNSFNNNIGDINLVIGSYPKTEQDVLKLKNRGITAVINL